MIVRIHWMNAYGYQCLLLLMKKQNLVEQHEKFREVQLGPDPSQDWIKGGAGEALQDVFIGLCLAQSALEEHVTKGSGKAGRENCSWLLFSTSCFSVSALSACQLQRGREMVLIPCGLEPEITFCVNNLQEIGCSLKST